MPRPPALQASKDSSAEEKKEYELIKGKAETYGHQELHDLFQRFQVTAPATGNELSFPMDFNMMFSTPIGPTGQLTGYLRPELAQGIFLNFKRMLEFNAGKLPFSGAQIGTAFRNEISPRNALIRVREFTLAEIEHFMDPEVEAHPGFPLVQDETLPFYSAEAQIAGQAPKTMSLKAAKESGLIKNESHGYFLGRIAMFLKAVGIDMEKVRFRQHMPNEMAHYAIDCWDAEIKTSFGWVECVGCAHRGSYDLVCHAKATKTDLMASTTLDEPISVEVVEIIADKGLVGRAFKKQAGLVNAHLAAMDAEAAAELEAKLAADGQVTFNLEGEDYVFEAKMLKSVKKKTKKIHGAPRHVPPPLPSPLPPSASPSAVLLLTHAASAPPSTGPLLTSGRRLQHRAQVCARRCRAFVRYRPDHLRDAGAQLRHPLRRRAESGVCVPAACVSARSLREVEGGLADGT